MPHMLHAWMLDPAGRRNLWCFSIFLCHLKQREENRRVSALSCFDDFEGSVLEEETDEKEPKEASRRKTHTHKTQHILIHLASLYTPTLWSTCVHFKRYCFSSQTRRNFTTILRSRLGVSFLFLMRARTNFPTSAKRLWIISGSLARNFRKLTPRGLFRTSYTDSKNSTNVLQGMQEARDPKSDAVQNREGVFVRARYAKFLPFFCVVVVKRARASEIRPGIDGDAKV